MSSTSEASWVHCRPGEAINFAQTDVVVTIFSQSPQMGDGWFNIVTARSEQRYAWPIIPGCVYRSDTLACVVELHRAHRISSDRWLAISLDAADVVIPNTELRLRPYWVSDAGTAVLLGIKNWTEVECSAVMTSDHKHDIFDWRTITPLLMPRAWHNPIHDWWCSHENFERFIQSEQLGWRTDPNTALPLQDACTKHSEYE